MAFDGPVHLQTFSKAAVPGLSDDTAAKVATLLYTDGLGSAAALQMTEPKVVQNLTGLSPNDSRLLKPAAAGYRFGATPREGGAGGLATVDQLEQVAARLEKRHEDWAHQQAKRLKSSITTPLTASEQGCDILQSAKQDVQLAQRIPQRQVPNQRQLSQPHRDLWVGMTIGCDDMELWTLEGSTVTRSGPKPLESRDGQTAEGLLVMIRVFAAESKDLGFHAPPPVQLDMADGRSAYLDTFLGVQGTTRDEPDCPALLVAVLQQVLKLIAWLNERRLLHRDLSPNNIGLYHEQGELKVVLFDLSTLRQMTEGPLGRLTGTPLYMALPLITEPGVARQTTATDLESLFYCLLDVATRRDLHWQNFALDEVPLT
ncbi:hypothetical protein WJX73_001542 [Symbiochloris irregularis]|uniref:Protein kinase domain-containing protein n=1 Tax=Symbiochloris irregularis TaxID=706552 RepID=A0AAW1PQG8_9CHLO